MEQGSVRLPPDPHAELALEALGERTKRRQRFEQSLRPRHVAVRIQRALPQHTFGRQHCRRLPDRPDGRRHGRGGQLRHVRREAHVLLDFHLAWSTSVLAVDVRRPVPRVVDGGRRVFPKHLPAPPPPPLGRRLVGAERRRRGAQRRAVAPARRPRDTQRGRVPRQHKRRVEREHAPRGAPLRRRYIERGGGVDDRQRAQHAARVRSHVD